MYDYKLQTVLIVCIGFVHIQVRDSKYFDLNIFFFNFLQRKMYAIFFIDYFMYIFFV